MQAPWELVAGVSIDGLEESEDDPGVHCDDVEVFGKCCIHDGYTDSTKGEDHDFERRSVLGCQPKWSAVLVV